MIKKEVWLNWFPVSISVSIVAVKQYGFIIRLFLSSRQPNLVALELFAKNEIDYFGVLHEC